jgi:hypothetical protein
MMGLGLTAAAVSGVAIGKGKSAAQNAVQRIRDAQFRPCPVSFSYQKFSPIRFLGIDDAWASSCTSPMEIRKSQVREALRLVEAEVDDAIQKSELALQRMQETERKLAGLSPSERAAKVKEMANGTGSEIQVEASRSQRSYEDAINRRGYQRLYNEQADYADKKARDLKNLQRLFLRHTGQPMGDGLWDMNAIAERLPPDQQAEFNLARRELKDSVGKEYQARMEIDRIERDPEVAKLKKAANSWNQEALRARRFAFDEKSFSVELEKERSAYSAALAEAKKARETLQNMKDMAEVAKSPADLYAVASRIHNFIPKESLIDPAKKVLSTTISQMGALANNLAEMEGKLTEAASGYLSKILPNVGKTGAAMRGLGLAAGRAVAFVGGAAFSIASFASNEPAGPCTAMPTSELFPANPDRGCDRFSFDNANVQKMAEMDPDALCALAKENPEVLQMINSNYGQYYGGMRGQCGPPLRVSSSGFGNATFNGKDLTFVPPGQTNAITIEFDSSGNESGVRMPNGRVQTRLQWGESAPFGRGDELESALRVYRQRMLPVLAEAKACCSSGDGVKPDPADCSKWDLVPSGGSGTPVRQNRSTR